MKTYDHKWLEEEWKRMGRPTRQTLDPSDGMWLDLWDYDYDFFGEAQYRIKCKPSINWEHVSNSIIAIATDRDGGTFLYQEYPMIDDNNWDSYKDYFMVDNFSSFTQGTCDWKDSLVMRPVVVGEE